MEMEAVMTQVLPWPPQHFPLAGKDMDALTHPTAPPKKVIQYVPILDYSRSSSSPSPLPHSSHTSLHHLTQCIHLLDPQLHPFPAPHCLLHLL